MLISSQIKDENQSLNRRAADMEEELKKMATRVVETGKENSRQEVT